MKTIGKTIGYVRVSSEKQSYERQVADIKKHCAYHDLELTNYQQVANDGVTLLCKNGIFSEKESGRKDERQALTALFTYLNNNPEVDNVVVQEISRLGRTIEVLQTIKKFTDKKVCLRILAPSQIITLDKYKNVDPSASMLTTMLTAISSYELNTMKSRMKSGLDTKRRLGTAGGTPFQPYGYYKDEQTKMLKIDPDEAEIIKDIFNRFFNGEGCRKIANYLNEKGVKNRTSKLNDVGKLKIPDKDSNTRCMWVQNTIRQMLTNEIYIGQRRRYDGKYKYELLPYIDEFRIISDEQFKAVKLRLKSNVNKQNVFTVNEYLLDARKIYCGICKDQHYFSKRTRKEIDGKIVLNSNVYACNSLSVKGQSCSNSSVPINKLERLVQSVLLSKYEDIFKSYLDTDESTKEIKEIEKELKNITLELQVQSKSEANIATLFALGKLNMNAFDIAINPIQTSIKNLNNQKQLIEDKLVIAKNNYENAIDVSNIKYKFNKKGVNISKDIINMMVTKIVITKETHTTIKNKSIIKALASPTLHPKYRLFESRRGNDQVFVVDIYFNKNKFSYLMSQRTDYVFDLQDSNVRYYGDIDTYTKKEFDTDKKIKYNTKAKDAMRNNLSFDIFKQFIPINLDVEITDDKTLMDVDQFVELILDVDNQDELLFDKLASSVNSKQKPISKEDIENSIIKYRRIENLL